MSEPAFVSVWTTPKLHEIFAKLSFMFQRIYFWFRQISIPNLAAGSIFRRAGSKVA